MLSREIQNDFLALCRQHMPGFPLTRSAYQSDEEFITDCYAQFEKVPMLMSGFTPYFAQNIYGDGTFGFNCLGRAIAIGAFLITAGYHVQLGMFPGHAIVIVQVGSELYYCDVARNYKIGKVMVKMHGTISSHKGYEWYAKVSDDIFFANHIVIHDFDRGIVNAILTNFSFLASDRNVTKLPKSDAGLYTLTAREYGYMTSIQSIEWKKVQKSMFGNMNAYIRDYKEQYLLERQRLEEQRYLRDLHIDFDKVIVAAFEKAVTKKTYFEQIRDFHDQHNPVLQSYKDQILQVLDTGAAFTDDIPAVIQKYFYAIREGICHSSELKDYALHFISKRCSKSQAA